MLNLEPLIARFVDDVLGAIRRASPEELRRALELEPPVRTAPRRKLQAAAPRQPVKAPAGRARPRPRPAALPARAVSLPAPEVTPAATTREPDAPAVGEITDPGALLDAAVAEYGAPRAYEWLLTTEETPQPESASTPSPRRQSEVALRAGESLARSSGNGVVIRRAKRG